MLQYMLEILIWTVILYSIFEIGKKFIYKFIITPEKMKELKNKKLIKCRTKSEN